MTTLSVVRSSRSSGAVLQWQLNRLTPAPIWLHRRPLPQTQFQVQRFKPMIAVLEENDDDNYLITRVHPPSDPGVAGKQVYNLSSHAAVKMPNNCHRDVFVNSTLELLRLTFSTNCSRQRQYYLVENSFTCEDFRCRVVLAPPIRFVPPKNPVLYAV
ncbi:hypothetical protein AXG93_673s1680 [Marchantia polymorpha subsp. ruderalis]|uniref:Uncharacterized protein n=1 Tax=Marchantia polymorpha subsp. ruderalis TaxID=1480154 RepID=A0A176WID7_MARPO|nr:hypothetical protein AXG93_673s1680 [Marchantia polymorpha subsp. ruderalis]